MTLIEISDEAKPVVSSELLAFVENVLACEGLTRWPVHIWQCKGEGVCDTTIRFGLCVTERQTKALFLHEVAHALLNPKRSCYAKDWHRDSYWHKAGWRKEFMRLCRTYGVVLRPMDAVTHYLSQGEGRR